MRALLLMRHAKSDWEADFDSDHDRPLNPRGVHNARMMGRVLSAQGLAPHLVISSTAVRARATAELAIEAGAWQAGLWLDRGLYETGPRDVLHTASSAPDVGRLMLVGHQPTWSMIVALLTGEPAEMKTATVAVIDIDLPSWEGLPGARGSLSRVLSPRDFVGSDWDRDH